ncbi:DUF4214 domain-containing protein [Orrella daihaiensis]|uniref:DUF4214 domain-containing protein n=1 Tax=Orrella daihaiensis TaxID=2782176 RepID=A0ABY4AJQ0_9BURK|nr:DUF4214 domain-containing protein [Orrella daihaiensis]UOD50409.1 DUF4214 domain-containing protein [Orrella daihaiensis]
MITDTNLSFNVNVIRGATPDLSGASVDAQNILEGLPFQPGGTAFVTGSDGRDYAYVFPTLFYRDPQLPGLEYVRSSDSGFELSRILNDVTMGSARDFAVISDGSAGTASFVVVDHGAEYADGGYQAWPFGHVWVATDRGDGFVFEQVSNTRAFNHAVDTGDLNGDGRVDVVSSHMGVKEGGVYVDLHAYLQQADGSFVQDRGFASVISQSWGSGAVALADIKGAGADQVIQVNYLHHEGNPDWGAIRVLERSGSGDYRVASVMPRDGLFNSMGATRVVPVDYDLDGDLDLVLSFEGQYGNLQGRYTGNGLEIYENDGLGGLERVTSELMARNAWSFSELQFREFEIVDFDGDGYQDIILNGWNGTANRSGADWNLAPQMFRNVDGQQFVQLSAAGARGLTLPGLLTTTEYIRVIDTFDSGPELFVMQQDGTPVTAVINALYRDASERLNAAGVGTDIKGYAGDDLFDVTGTNLSLDGGVGLDTAAYRVSFAMVTIDRRGDDEWIVTSAGSDSDTLKSIERLSFTDVNVALDISGISGQAYRIYQAAFDRAPDTSGLGYWIAQMDQGASLSSVAMGFVQSLEFETRYGASSSDEQFVDLLYANVLDRQPDQSGYDYWIDVMSKGLSRADVLAYFSESAENIANVQDAIAGGIVYLPYGESG